VHRANGSLHGAPGQIVQRMVQLAPFRKVAAVKGPGNGVFTRTRRGSLQSCKKSVMERGIYAVSARDPSAISVSFEHLKHSYAEAA